MFMLVVGVHHRLNESKDMLVGEKGPSGISIS